MRKKKDSEKTEGRKKDVPQTHVDITFQNQESAHADG